MKSRPYLSSPLLVRVLLLAFIVTCCLSLSTGGVGGQTSSDDHGDTIHTATDLPLGSSVGGRIDPGDDQDVFRLDLSRESSDTDLWIYATGDLDTFGELLTSTGEVIVSNDNGYIEGRWNAFHIRWNLSPGVYYVRVAAGQDGPTGDYALHAQAVTVYPGSTTGTATALELDSPTPGMIDSATEAEYFRLDLTDSKDMFIYATGLDMFDQDGWLPFNPVVLEALDSRGTEIPVNVDKIAAGVRIRDGFEPGTYYIRVITPEQSEYLQGIESSYPVPYTIHAYEDSDYTNFIEGCEADTRELNASEINDSLYGCQWHLNNSEGEDINVEAVWAEGITGAGVNIAVVDDGMDHRHEDLRDNVDESRNHDYSDRGDVHDPYMHHGTNVAGIIAAQDNSIGVRGVAPGATVYGYNFLHPAANTDVEMADSMGRNREVTAVSNNSWGSVGYIGLAPRIWELAVDAGIREGHEGKGVFYAFAAGNGYFGGNEANLGEVGNYHGVTAVCAVGDNDVRSPYSETGANLWVCAPSNGGNLGIVTTDNSDRYDPRFGGTSAATPIVSGVVALMREANPDLTWRDLKLVLAASARKNDAGNLGWEDGAHKYGAESDTDRYHFNHEYGFGMVDAKAAVELAEGWSNLPPFESSKVESDELNLPVPDVPASGDPTALESTLMMTTSVGFIEFVEIDLSLEHDSFRDLDIELVSPSGSVSKLVGHFDTYERFGEYVPLHSALRFGSARHLGEDPNGEWKLRIADRIPNMAGSLASWDLTVYGHESTPGPPTVDWITTGDDSLIVGWVAPTQTGGSAVTAYDLRYISASADETVDSNWTVVEDAWTANSGGNLEYTITGLLGDARYAVQVRAVNEVGAGRWSEAFTATTTRSPCSISGTVEDPASNPGLVSDCTVLMEGRDALVGSGSLDWSAGTPIASWEGVKVRGTPRRVVELSLRNRGLTGVIPMQLGSLINLQGLSLGSNQLTGEIPGELDRLAKLEWVYLNNNRLTGEIPAALGSLANLTELDLSSNRLSGEIPEDLRGLAGLAHLSLNGNELSGEIPAWLGHLPDLHSLNLSGNSFTGCIPESLQDIADHDLERLGIPFCGRSVLVAIYNATDGPNWKNSTNWLSDRPIGEWYGVTTDTYGHVTTLNLSVNLLSGAIPRELGSLSHLQHLDISANRLTGEIPTSLDSLSNLQHLSLGANELTGEIPASLGNLSKLEVLYLEWNQLSGDIPAELGNLANLRQLIIPGSRLSGEIPAELGSLSNLQRLYLNDNQLTGEIPPELGGLSNLTWLDLEFNQLTGEIPPELGGLSNLEWLILADNGLTGEIPPELGGLSNLERLYLGGNLLTGCVPAGLRDVPNNDIVSLGLPFCSEQACVSGGAVVDATNTGLISDCEALLAAQDTLAGTAALNWSADTPIADWNGVVLGETSGRVTEIFLVRMGLNGRIPKELGGLANLTELVLADNGLTGEIPPELGGLSNLTELGLSSNQLTGEIPPELGGLSNLTGLFLYRNQLTGEIPPELGGLSNLTRLWLQHNQLTGEIPPELGGLSNLTDLRLHGNQLTGEIPPELDGLSNLTDLSLSGNQLTGEIPPELGGLSNLTDLSLSGNQLTGEIPPELGGLSNLTRLILSDNGLTGEIPPELGGLSNLTTLYLSGNQLTGEIPPELGGLANLRWLSLYRNQLTGEIPPELVGLSNLTGLYLYANQLTGEILPELGGLSNLRELSLYANQLTGEIPTELGNLSNLTWLWLHGNQLTGEIPPELGGLSKLTGLWLHGNQLTGEIPPELGGLANLRWLYLGGNLLTGCVPAGLRDVPNNDIVKLGLPFCSEHPCVSGGAVPDATNTGLVSDCGMLLAARDTLAGTASLNWSADTPITEWNGVVLGETSGRVTEILLGGMGLNGRIPPELGSLSNLTRLSLSVNQLTGEIPPELGGLANLTELYLWDNQLTGEIPPELGGLSNLEWLSLWGNQLTGEIPPELGGLANLTELRLHGNQLTGEIPPELGGLANLTRLFLADNGLTGEIPPELGGLANLTGLYLYDNQLTGEIPPELGRLSNLTWLRLHGNQLTGEIPPELGGLSNLTWLGLDNNQLTGEIPPELGGLSNLRWLFLSDNRLTGCVPPRLRDVPTNDLDQLGLPFCPLSPPEASTISSVTSEMDSITISWATPLSDGGSDITAYDLRHIETDDDETVDPNWTVVEDVWTTGSGALEYTLTGLTVGTEYDIQVRAVNAVGDGPWSATVTATLTTVSTCAAGVAVPDPTSNPGLVSDCESLLTLLDTLVEGTVLNWSEDTPIARWDGVRLAGTPQRVTRLVLPGKGLRGTIPPDLGRLSMLTDLNLRSNALTGEIPEELGNLTNLRVLNLRSNALTGEIPEELGNLTNLRVLNLHSNKLSGDLPDLSRITGLEELYLPNNYDETVQDSGLTGTVPTWLNGMTKMRELWLWGNQLSGTIPDLSGMTSLQKLKLANNMLTGGVPDGSMLPPNVTWLIIDSNPLGGGIPDLSELTSLRLLWLHSNGLTGSIPAGDMLPPNVDDLNLRDNMLSGEIPDLSGLDKATRVRLHGNDLSGEIPATLGDLDSLQSLWLHGNILTGSIPKELGSLTNLQRLWLSDNNLSGQIPVELGDLSSHSLVQWRLSGEEHQFTGCLPAGLAEVKDTDFNSLGLQVCTSTTGQPHVMLRVVQVTEDWVPFSVAGGWTQAVLQKESDVLRYYEAAIWEETDSVHLYAFPNDYDGLFGWDEDVPDADVIAYREQYAISVHSDMPEMWGDRRSDFLRIAFEDFVSRLVELHPEADHHLMYHGHGGPGGNLFAGQLKHDDAGAFLATWTRLLGKPLGVIDMGGPCNKGAYEDLANFCRHASYYVASDLPNGGYTEDDWTYEKHQETNPETQYHRLLASNETLEEALIERVELRRKRYEYSMNNQIRDQVEQANYVYSCARFNDFYEAFELFVDVTTIQAPSHDLYQLMLDYRAPPALLDRFRDVFVHGVDNRDFFEWEVTANGMLSPSSR